MSAAVGTRPRIVVVAGPTASGKTELAAELARRLDGEVVGADSRQVYRYMDVATAKPSPDLRREIPHHLIDVVEPDEDYDASRWRKDAMAAVARIGAAGRTPVVCGGTGLYIRSLLQGLFRGPAADPALRARLEADERREPGSLHARLARCDETAAARLHPNDLVRIVRALEVFELTGRTLSSWHEEHALQEQPFDALMLEVDVSKEELAERIERRSRRMVDDGLLDEVRGLRDRGYGFELKAFDAIGYREAVACLEGRLDEAALAHEIAKATRRYAKRQRVWLRGQASTVRVAADDVDAVAERVAGFLDRVATQDGIG